MPTRRLRAAVFAATARRHATRLGAATALVGHLIGAEPSAAGRITARSIRSSGRGRVRVWSPCVGRSAPLAGRSARESPGFGGISRAMRLPVEPPSAQGLRREQDDDVEGPARRPAVLSERGGERFGGTLPGAADVAESITACRGL